MELRPDPKLVPEGEQLKLEDLPESDGTAGDSSYDGEETEESTDTEEEEEEEEEETDEEEVQIVMPDAAAPKRKRADRPTDPDATKKPRKEGLTDRRP